MTAVTRPRDRPLVVSIAAVWKSYFDQQSESLAAAMRPWQTTPGPSRLWESYRGLAALGVASLLTELAGGPFARLYQSSLIDAEQERRS